MNVTLTWLPAWRAYAVRIDGRRLVGLLVTRPPLAFRGGVSARFA
jgi:hypothetical protein